MTDKAESSDLTDRAGKPRQGTFLSDGLVIHWKDLHPVGVPDTGCTVTDVLQAAIHRLEFLLANETSTGDEQRRWAKEHCEQALRTLQEAECAT